MIQHLFISPLDIQSPRWQQAFPTALITQDSPVSVQADCLWVLLRDENNFAQLESLSGQGKKIIAMTLAEAPDEARRALEAGASGYVHYLAAPVVLEQVAQVVAAGGMWLGADLMRQLVLATSRSLPVEPVKATNGDGVDLSRLTSRELMVARLVAAGKTNKEVARELDITERTVKAHLGSAFEKLKVRDRLHMVLVIAAADGA